MILLQKNNILGVVTHNLNRYTTGLWLTYKVVHNKLGIGGEFVDFRPCMHALKGQWCTVKPLLKDLPRSRHSQYNSQIL